MQQNKSGRPILRQFKPVLQITLVAFAVDLFLLFRMAYMGTSDPSASKVIVEHFIPVVIQVQAGILLKLFAVASLLWLWVRQGLYLQGRRSVILLVTYWVGVVIRHARQWPAPYVDILESRPLPESLFKAVIEGWTGRILLVLLSLVCLAAVIRQIQQEIRRPRLPLARVLTRTLSLVVGVWFIWWVGSDPILPSWSRQPTADPVRPDIILLAADSLRADHFACDATAPVMPRLGALCEDNGGQFGPYYTVQNRTMGSMSALFTGLRPEESGIYHMFTRREKRNIVDRSLVSEFNKMGYRTVVVSSFAGDLFPRVELGFQEVYAPRFGFRAVIGDFSLRAHPLIYPFFATHNLGRLVAPYFENFMDLADPQLEAQKAYLVAAVPDTRPLFLVVFLSGTHFPYSGRPGYDWRKGNDPVRARYRWYAAIPGEGGTIDHQLYPAIRHRYADNAQQVDMVFADMAEAAVHNGNTMVLVTSDHGEELYELDAGGHGDHVYGNMSLEVPLLVLDSRPGIVQHYAKAPVTDAVYSSLDLMPALLTAVTNRLPLRLPDRQQVFAESGLIISAANPKLLEGRRLAYPAVMGVLEVDMAIGDMVVRKEWEETVEDGKFRTMITPKWQFVYSPGCREPRMVMAARGSNEEGHPDQSVDAAYPEEVDKAWDAMSRIWPKRIRRHCAAAIEETMDDVPVPDKLD